MHIAMVTSSPAPLRALEIATWVRAATQGIGPTPNLGRFLGWIRHLKFFPSLRAKDRRYSGIAFVAYSMKFAAMAAWLNFRIPTGCLAASVADVQDRVPHR